MCMSTRGYENSFETHTYIYFSLNLDQDGKVDRYICVDIDISFWAYIITWVCMINLYDNGNTCTI